MFRVPPRTRRSLLVTLIGPEASLIDGLGRYLKRRVSCRALLTLGHGVESAVTSDVVVIYPDGFAVSTMTRSVRRLLRSPEVSLVIVVTETPARFRDLDRARRAANRLIILSKPVWPWTIFATIQSGVPKLRRRPLELS